MNKSHRYFIAVFMTTVYLLLVFSPLAPFAWHSNHVHGYHESFHSLRTDH